MADDVDLDLFGHPTGPMRDPRGRKSHRKTKENQRLVVELRGGGMTQAEVATYMGCDEKTLRKYYSRELEEAAVLLKGMAIRVLVRKMAEGSLAAVNKVIERIDARPTQRGKAADRREPEPGKKELARRQARDVPDDWGDLIPEGPIQ